MKLKWIVGCLIASSFVSIARADDDTGSNDQNPVWAIFADELDSFMDQAQALKAEGILINNDRNQDQIAELQSTAERIAGIYFTELESSIRPQLEAFLKQRIEENSDLDAFLILLGNGFYHRAEAFLENQKKKNKQIRTWSVMGGTALGIVAGGFIIYVKPQLVEGIVKQGLLVLGTAAVGAGLGYAGSYVATKFALPVDPSVGNAKDFLELYPDGSSFIQHFDSQNQDIADFRDELEGMGG